MSKSVQKAEQVWKTVLGDLEVQVPRPSYETWLSGTVGLAYADDEFVVGAPNAFVAEMLEQRMYSLISHALQRVVNESAEIRFQVLSQTNGSTSSNGEGNTMIRDTDADTHVLSTDADAHGDGPQTQVAPLERDALGYRKTKLNSKYTFGTFIVGKSNELAHAAAEAVSERPGQILQPPLHLLGRWLR